MKSIPVQAGFTLIEVLVALAIVSVALAASMRALGISSNGAKTMQESSLALQVAGNHLAELRLLRTLPKLGRQTTACPQGRFAFVCEQQVQSTVNGNFRLVTVKVSLDNGHVLAELNGLMSPLP